MAENKEKEQWIEIKCQTVTENTHNWKQPGKNKQENWNLNSRSYSNKLPEKSQNFDRI